MSMLSWLYGMLTRRGKALWHYRCGMKHANSQQHRLAIECYSAAIALPKAPTDVQAMARYNRALVYATIGQQEAAVDDLEYVLSLPLKLPEIKAAARQRLARMNSRTDQRGD
jgi:tetratricopeptide (TPR) repeat protein